MAIFDSEKRPRGLRVPSLTAMKAGTAASVSQFSFHRTKSNDAPTPEEKPAPPLPVPSSGFPAPAPAPPPTKQLPVPPQTQGPKKELPPRPTITSKVPPRRAVGSTKGRPNETSPTSATSQGQGIRQASSPITPSSPPNKDQPLPPTPSLGLRQAASTTTVTTQIPTSPQPEQEAASPATIKASNSHQGLRHAEPTSSASPQLSKPQPAPVRQAQQQLPPTPPVGPQSTGSPEPTAPAPSQYLPKQSQQPPVQQRLPPTPPPVTLSPPPPTTDAEADEETDALTPLEDFIPTPDGASTPLEEEMSSIEATPPGPAHPPALHEVVDIPAAPLNKVHFACFQEHRNMPIAQNVWCPVPCMTCHKKDQEIRHRRRGGEI
ncbi:unnamed protein product [Penicillium manginii]